MSEDLLDRRQRLAACTLLSAIDLPANAADVAEHALAAAAVCPGVAVGEVPLGEGRQAGLIAAARLINEMLAEISPTEEHPNLAGRLRMWPAGYPGEKTLSSAVVSALMTAAADRIDMAAEFIAGLEKGLDSPALADVLKERQRQISFEGWTPEHDDEHRDRSLARAAAAYAYLGALDEETAREYADRFVMETGTGVLDSLWPWDEAWLKPTDPRRNLVKAGALIVAEIERLDRAEAKATAEAGADA